MALLCCLFGCDSKNQSDDAEKRIHQLEKENRELRENTNPVQENVPIDQYTLIVLDVETYVNKTPEEMKGEVLFEPYKKYRGHYVSNVRTESDDSESNKYRLMDEFQADFMRGSREGKVQGRNIYFYPTYEEASKARERLMLSR